MRPYATLAILGVCLLVLALSRGSQDTLTLLRWGADYRPLVMGGQWWRLYACTFVQAGWLQAVVSLISLGWLGRVLEPHYGWKGWLGLYSVCALASSTAATRVVAGSTGVICGMCATLTVLALRGQCQPGRWLIPVALGNLGLIYGLGLDPLACLAGLTAGAVFAVLPKPRQARGSAVVLLLILGLAPLGAEVWALRWASRYTGLASYPSVLYTGSHYRLSYPLWLQPVPDSRGGGVTFQGPADVLSVYAAHGLAEGSASVRQRPERFQTLLPRGMEVEKTGEDPRTDRVWLRWTLMGWCSGVQLLTMQGHEVFELRLLYGPGVPADQALDLLARMEDSFHILNASDNDVQAQRSLEEAMGQLMQGHPDKALEQLDQVLQLDPKNVEALLTRGILNASQGHKELARKDYDAALQLDPKEPRLYLNRAMLAVDEGHYPAALPDLNQAVQMAAHLPVDALVDTLNARALCSAHAGDLPAALDDATRALSFKPPPAVRALVLLTRGYAYSRSQKTREALQDYKEAEQADPKLADPYLHRGQLLWDLGRRDEARTDLEQFLRLSPFRAEAAQVRKLLKR